MKQWDCLFELVVRVNANTDVRAEEQALEAVQRMDDRESFQARTAAGVVAVRVKNYDLQPAYKGPLAPGDL